MARTVLADTGFLVALLSRRDRHRRWAAAQAAELPHPWITCEAVLSETSHLLGPPGTPPLAALLGRDVLTPGFDLRANLEAVLVLMAKYADVPMSLADACLVRMTEILADPIVLTTDADFSLYRRHSRQVIPYVMP
jgi:predicted nucleic acid-binding protein